MRLRGGASYAKSLYKQEFLTCLLSIYIFSLAWVPTSAYFPGSTGLVKRPICPGWNPNRGRISNPMQREWPNPFPIQNLYCYWDCLLVVSLHRKSRRSDLLSTYSCFRPSFPQQNFRQCCDCFGISLYTNSAGEAGESGAYGYGHLAWGSESQRRSRS